MKGDQGFKRGDRVAREVQRALSDALARRVSDPRLRGVVVTVVKMSDDLRSARVWWHLLREGEEARIPEVERALARAARLLRAAVGEAVGLKVTPELRFVYDRGLDHARHIEDLLAQLPRSEPDESPEE